MNKLDSVDIKLLELLQLNSNKGIKELALEVGLTATPVYERIKRLEKSGVIKKYGIADKIDAVFTFSGGGDNDRCMAQLSKTLKNIKNECSKKYQYKP